MITSYHILSMYANRQLAINMKQNKKTIERLSSGYRINRSADDAANLAISEKMRAQIRGLGQGVKNVQDGISFCNVAEGALQEVHSILGRIKELSVQAASDTYVKEDREAIEDEFVQMKKEINRISKTTEFNGKRIFDDGSFKIEFSDDICAIKIFNANHGSPDSPDTYGGIIVGDDVRVAWNAIDPKMVITDPKTGETVFRAGDYRYEINGYGLTIHCEYGSSPPEIKVEFEVSAGGRGISIAGASVDWEDVVNEEGESILEHLGEGGYYHFKHNGGEGGFYVEEGAMLGDIIRGLNQYNETVRKRYYNVYNGYYTTQAVDVIDAGSRVQVTQDIYDNFIKANQSSNVGIQLKADKTAVWTVDENGNEFAGSRKTWAELGLEHWDSTNDVSDTKKYGYRYRSADGKVDVEFEFFLLDETSKESVIEGINDMNFKKGAGIASNQTLLDVAAGGNLISGELKSVYNPWTLEEEGEFGRNFDAKTDTIASSVMTYDKDNDKLQLIFDSGTKQISYESVQLTSKAELESEVKGLPTQYLIARAVQGLMDGTGTLRNTTLEDVVGSGNITTTGYMSEQYTVGADTVKTGRLGNGTYAAASIDFSGLGTAYQLYDLLGTGFDSTCITCDNHYSVMFTYGNAENTTRSGYGYSLRQDKDNNYTLMVDLKSMLEQGIGNGAEFSKALVEIMDGNGTGAEFDFHYTQYAADNSGKLYVCDNRPELAGSSQVSSGSFYVQPYQSGQMTIDAALRNTTDNRSMSMQYSYDVFKKLSVDAVEESDDANGKFVKNASGAWERYDASKYYDAAGNLLPGMAAPKRYNIRVNNNNDTLDWEKIYDDIMQEIAGKSEVYVEATNFAYLGCAADENPNEAYASTFLFRIEEDEDAGMWIQSGANRYQGILMAWDGFSSHYLGLSGLHMTDREEAGTLIRRADHAIRKISGIRSAFGAYANRLEHMYDMNRNYAENLQSAESLLRDAKMAEEMMTYARNNILTQAAQAMLVQTKQNAEGVLKLLQ
ncbi:MAG: flagellin [Lachnospiraceae bacterium]